MPLTSKHLRDLADALDAEETETQAALDQAEAAKASEERIAQLEAKLEELAAKKEQVEDDAESLENADEPKAGPRAVPDAPKKNTRPGRKRGEMYEDDETGDAYVWDQDDEADQVKIEEDAA